MRVIALQVLTWGTIAAAVASAAWLSSTSQTPVFCSVSYRATSQALGLEQDDPPLPASTTGAVRAGARPAVVDIPLPASTTAPAKAAQLTSS
ncbi:MAG TPA: hypothetical protein VF457_03420 [Burkholderiaceae bacterium]